MIDLLEPHRDAALENPFLQYMLVAELSAAYSAAGRYADAKRLFETHPIPPADEDNDMALVAQATRATALLLEGNVREAERVGSALLARSVQAVGRHSISANICACVLADAYYELDRIDDARENDRESPRAAAVVRTGCDDTHVALPRAARHAARGRRRRAGVRATANRASAQHAPDARRRSYAG